MPSYEVFFRYRGSSLMDEGCIVLGADLKLRKGDQEAIRARMNELMEQRRSKQPLEYPSAGSTFKRPQGEGLFAGKMISDAGLKGVSVGGAMVSEKHAGFVINTGGASSSDIYALMKLVQEKVYALNGIMLEPEVRLLGEFDGKTE